MPLTAVPSPSPLADPTGPALLSTISVPSAVSGPALVAVAVVVIVLVLLLVNRLPKR